MAEKSHAQKIAAFLSNLKWMRVMKGKKQRISGLRMNP